MSFSRKLALAVPALALIAAAFPLASPALAHTEKEAIGIAQAMLFETDIALFDLVWCENTEWQANLVDAGVPCR